MSAGQWLSTRVALALQAHWEGGGTSKKTLAHLEREYETWRQSRKGQRGKLSSRRQAASSTQQSLFRGES